MTEYLIRDTTLTQIADAIREKGGVTNAMFPEDMPRYIRAISGASDTDDLPGYVAEEARRVANGMISKMGSNAVTFLAVSDMHELGDKDVTDENTLTRYRAANKHAGQGAKQISDIISLDFAALLGDFAWGAKTTQMAEGVASLVRCREYFADLIRDNETFLTPGNHDTMTYGYEQNGEYLSHTVMEGLTGTYRYLDLPAKKVRVICLNTADTEGMSVSGSSGTERISGKQLQWFAESLDLSGKSDAADWGILILSHHPLDWGSILPAANVLQAYLTGGSYSATHNGVAVSYNFSGRNAAAVIAQFHGHVHGFRVDYIHHNIGGTIAPTTVKRVAIPNACYGRNNEYGENSGTDTNGIEFGETATYDKSEGTAKDTAFCLVSIDLEKKIIYADCYGAGYDRIIPYAGEKAVTYTVTNHLTNVVNNNSAVTVLEGSAYGAALAAKSGYALDTVTVTMDGVDISAAVYSGGIVSIGNVTGDIVITATAAASDDGTYVNLVPLSTSDGMTIFNAPYGYENGKYLSSGTVNAYSTDAACVATGNILLGSDVDAIYIRGAAWDTSNSHVRFFAGSSVGGLGYTIYADGSGSAPLEDFFAVEVLGENYCKWTLTEQGRTYLRGKYYRVSLVGQGEDLIITHDEPIPEDAGGETVKTFPITNALTNVTNSNTAASIAEGAAYSAALTAADGYSIRSVQVTMGGEDVTASVYSGGKISIAGVTGDIVISAAAEKAAESGTSNLSSMAQAMDSTEPYNGTGYKNGYYLSSTSPFEGVDADTVLTGYIPYPVQDTGIPGTIYIKGARWQDIGHCRLFFFNSAKTSIVGPQINGAGSENNAIDRYYTVEELGDQYYRLTPIVNEASATGNWTAIAVTASVINTAFFRMSLAGTGENLIITIDQPIE